MRSKLLSIFLLFLTLILLVPRILATTEQAYQDYLYQYDLYRQSHNEFEIAKNEYEKFGTLVSQSTALESTKKMLLQRDELIKSYLNLLKEGVNETRGLSTSETQLYQSLIDNEIVFLNGHIGLIPAVESLGDAVKVSKELEGHHMILQKSIRQIMVGISLGIVRELQQEYDTVVSSLQVIVNENRAMLTPREQALSDRWMLQISNKRSLSAQKHEEATLLNNQLEGRNVMALDQDYSKIQQLVIESRQYLQEGSSFIQELLTTLKYQN